MWNTVCIRVYYMPLLACSMATNFSKAVFSVVNSFWGESPAASKPAKTAGMSFKPGCFGFIQQLLSTEALSNTLPASAKEPATELPVRVSLRDAKRVVQSVAMVSVCLHAITFCQTTARRLARGA
jgi:hypothetical protein